MAAPKADKAQLDKFQKSYKDLQKLQGDSTEHKNATRQLEAQLNENTMVLNEINLIDGSDNIYKMVGPALIKQDLEEVKMNVKNRISHITGEVKRHEDADRKIEESRNEIIMDMKKLEAQLMESMQKSGLVQKN